MAARTWFLPPGTSFTPDGIIRLGAVIKDFKRPTLILLEPDADTYPKSSLPPIEVLNEQEHAHTRGRSRSVGGEIWTKFLDVASASINLDLETRNKLEFGPTDHSVHQFKRSFTPEFLKAIVSQPAVRQYIDSGVFGKRPVYVVSGLRVVNTGMPVTVDKGYTHSFGIKGSGPPAGTVPVEAGADLHAGVSKDNTDSWVTAPGIIFCLQTQRCSREKGRQSRV
jgi:hypothetical protein